jgi:hypothetical protein
VGLGGRNWFAAAICSGSPSRLFNRGYSPVLPSENRFPNASLSDYTYSAGTMAEFGKPAVMAHLAVYSM